jgi:antitoxin component YwqK of YwqJK toxin-antitoxin module
MLPVCIPKRKLVRFSHDKGFESAIVSNGEMHMADLNIAEILSEEGRVRFRYARYLSEDGTRWIRHGRFEAYHVNGAVASEGTFVHGLEQGEWRDFYPNGQIAAQGAYQDGEEVGDWQFFDEHRAVPEEAREQS